MTRMNKTIRSSLLGLIVSLTLLSCSDSGENFSVKVSKFNTGDIAKVIFKIDDTEFSFSKFNEYGERKVYISVPNTEGHFDVIVEFENGSTLTKKSNDYKSGFPIYITIHADKIVYVKAHWG